MEDSYPKPYGTNGNGTNGTTKATPSFGAPSFGGQVASESTSLLANPRYKHAPSPDIEYDVNAAAEDAASSVDSQNQNSHQTNVLETFLHLVKGYMGAGCLSLPWAVSQLGIVGGVLGIVTMSLWTSYNCWIVVSIKRYMMNQNQLLQPLEKQDDDNASSANSSNITYPEVGAWAYGGRFQSYVTACICTQQLAICTVFVSFVGENLLAVFLKFGIPVTHVGVMTMALPCILLLSFSPSLKTLAPVMALGTILLGVTLAALGYIVTMEWPDRPEETPEVQTSKIPLALCAILYSYEGICLILPVESAMEKPEQFGKVFWLAMALVALMLAGVAVLCVMAFGNVTSGSVTAFLLETYDDDETITFWIMVANTAVSLSVLLTYPLQLFPALELLGPTLQQNKYLSKIFGKPDEDRDDDSLSGFDPLPPLPEDDVASLESMPTEHHYYEQDDTANIGAANGPNDDDGDAVSFSGMSDVTSMMGLPVMTMQGDSLQLRAALVLATYLVAVVVPNVQSLISLAGALAGSSTALLIPPILELAFMEHLDKINEPHGGTTVIDVTLSPHMMRRKSAQNINTNNANKPASTEWAAGAFRFERIKCYALFGLGFIFMGIGTWASVMDIIKIYMGK